MRAKHIIYLLVLFVVFLIMDITSSNLVNAYLTPVLVSFLIVFLSEKQSIYFIIAFTVIFDTIFSSFIGFYLFIALLMLTVSYIIKQFYSVNKFLLYIAICAISEFALVARISLHKGMIFSIVSIIIAIIAYPLFSKMLKNAGAINE